MAAAVTRWMGSSDVAVKSEFVTPWGICDLVGLAFNRRNSDHRLRLGQRKAIGSIARAMVLLQIPDVKTGMSITRGKLARQFAPSIPEEVVFEHIDQLIADRFVEPCPRGRLQKENGWHPLQDRLVAVELKLSRIGEAMHQALNNLVFAEESYVGFPAEVARRVASNTARWSDFFDAGVGLLSVTRRGCKVLVPAHSNEDWADEAVRFYCVEKFWRTRIKGN